ncbi:MAG: hypothetical protein U1D35_09235 [Paracoccaceae bacterium]|nr:hypothetical protein [Paracoccaceae bacterium]
MTRLRHWKAEYAINGSMASKFIPAPRLTLWVPTLVALLLCGAFAAALALV